MHYSDVVLPRTASVLILKNRRIPTFSMGDYP